MAIVAGSVSQTAKPADHKGGPLKVFISYCRADLDFADQLYAALELYGYDATIDRHEVSAGEEWKVRLSNLIREADTIAFVLSPASASSPICAWEVDEAARLGKRILPVLCRPLEAVVPPERLANLNYIFFYPDNASPGSGFGVGLVALTSALNTDLDWLREHTRLLVRATEWENAGRVENRMLSGDQVAQAKAWAARRPRNAPEPTPLHLDFIRASEAAEDARRNAEAQRLVEMAAAQEQRAKALADAEVALKSAAEAQKARARAQRITVWGSSLSALVLAGIAVIAWQQRNEAVVQKTLAKEQTRRAKDILGDATELISNLANAKKLDPDNFDLAARVFKRGEELGDASSMLGLGQLYHFGIGVAPDYAKAHEWYEKAAAKGDALAENNIGALYTRGDGVPQDYTKARESYERAASKDNVLAITNLGDFYAHGMGVVKDYAKARELYERAIGKGHARAMTHLGLLYDDGNGVPQDYAKEREWLEKAAAKDDSLAMANLGGLYVDGRGVPQDYAKALEWFQKAAAQDEPLALYNLGALYADGRGVTQDYAKAREWYEKAAAKEVPLALNNLGVLYESGQGVPQDYSKAREWYQKAADQDLPLAMSNLGVLYENGHGVALDYDLARSWYEKAAAKGWANAMSNLGKLYFAAHGVPQDYVKARDWWEKAAALDSEMAMNNLGVLFDGGHGVPQDYAIAREWYEKAAAKNIALAMNNLGALYENGRGVARDYAKAREWYEKAASNGHADAKLILELLPVRQAQAEGRYGDALRLQEASVAKIEDAESKRDGKPNAETVSALLHLSWIALLARDFAKGLAASERAHMLAPDDIGIEINRAHALLLLDRADEARRVYMAHRREKLSDGETLWEAGIADDFAELRKAGVESPLMNEIEAALKTPPAAAPTQPAPPISATAP